MPNSAPLSSPGATAAPLRLGLVGLGKIATDEHLPAIAGLPEVALAAVASRNAQLAGVPGFATLEAMLAAGPALDAVVLCQPPQPRFAAARTALLAGKHVFLEKPPGATLSEVEALAGLARERGVSLFASWHSRAGAAVGGARAWLAGATIRSGSIVWKEDVRVWHPGQAWIWEPGGFGVFDPGINALSILTHIVPESVRLVAAALEVPANRAAPIAARLALESLGGAPIAAEFDFRQQGAQCWDIALETDRGSLLLSDGGNRLTLDGAAQDVGPSGEYPALYQRFAALVRAGESEVDVAPLRLVADAFLIGRSRACEPFEE